jgi:hypothetical protein
MLTWDTVLVLWDTVPVPWDTAPVLLAYAYIYHGVFVCVVFMIYIYIYFLLHDLTASSFSIPRLYATGLGDVSVLRHEVTYIWQ